MIRRTTSALLLLADVFLLAGGARTDLFTVSSDSNSIVRFDSSGTPTFVTASGGFPQFIAFDSHGDFYVSSPTLGAVHKYSQTGTDLGNFVQSVPGASGLAFDSNGNLYVSSNASSQIRKFSPTGANLGVFASVLDSLSPGIAFDAQGNLYATEHNFNDIRKFSPTGANLGVFASAGLDAPFDLEFDQLGNLYVASLHLPTIHEYSSSGSDLGIFATGQFNSLTGLAFDTSGNLYVSNGGGRNTIRKFSPTGVDLGNFASTGLNNPEGLAFAPQVAAVPEPSALVLAGTGLIYFLGSLAGARSKARRGGSKVEYASWNSRRASDVAR